MKMIRLATKLIIVIGLIVESGAVEACQGTQTSRQVDLGKLLLKSNYSSISCKYLGQPYGYFGNAAHAGIDYPSSAGRAIYAPVSGTYIQSYTQNTSNGSASYVILSNGKRLFIHHMKNRLYGYKNKGEKIGEIYSDHVHAELRVNYSGSYLISGSSGSCGSNTCSLSQLQSITDDPSEVVVSGAVNTPPTYVSGSISNSVFNSGQVVRFLTSWTDQQGDSIVDVRVRYRRLGSNSWLNEQVLTWISGTNASFEKLISVTGIGGDYEFQFRASDNASPVETSNWINGGTFKINAPTSPDLVVQSLNVSDTTLAPGQSFTTSAITRNQGTAASHSSTLRFYLSTNSTITSSDSQLSTDLVNALSAGATENDSDNHTAPTATGTYWIGACVDAVSGESNTGNNCSSGVQVVVAATTAPDLVVQSPSVSDTTLEPGQSFTTSATTRNQGTAASHSSTLRFYLSTNSTITSSDSQLSTDLVNALSAGATENDSDNHTAPTATGTYWIGACVDAVSGESNTGNNCSSGVQVVVAATTAPDLVVQSPSVSDTTLEPGQSFTTSATTRNQGTAASHSSTLRFYLSTNSTITSSDSQLSTDLVNALSAGATENDSDNHTAPTATGTYWIGACVDAVSGESNTGNNCSSGVQVVVAATTAPDLVVQSPSVSDTTLEPGQSFTTSATTRNQGTAASHSSTLRFYLSTNSTITSSDSQLSTDLVNALSAGATENDSDNHTAPTATGTYWIGACVDAVSGESNTGNNCSSGVQVVVAATTAPDLVVQSPSVSDTTLEPGQSFMTSATTRNQGTAASHSSTLRFYLSTNSTITSSDSQLSTDLVNALSAGATENDSDNHTAPTATGTYWIGACVDAVSGESNTGNNCSSGVQVTVSSMTNITPDIYEVDDNSGLAKTIQLNVQQSHNIHIAGDEDWVTFTLSVAVDDFTVETNGTFNGDTIIYLYDQNYSLIASDNDSGIDSYSKISPRRLEAGKYYIRITEYTNAATIFEYSLLMKYEPPKDESLCFPIQSTTGKMVVICL